MNSYFASVEQQLHPELRGKPIGVTGKRTERSVVAAASQEAKRLGVKTAMATWKAKRICPSIILVPGTPGAYGKITKTFNAIFARYAYAVERFSVDESFLDVTDSAKDYLGAIAIAQTIKDDLRRECGEYITASIGIAPNKSLAKAASECMKPDGLTVVRPEEAITFLDSLALQDICGIGRRMAKRLEAMGITTVPQLRATPPYLLEEEFQSYGLWLARLVRGLDEHAVQGEEEPAKSYGHSYTLPRDAFDERTVRQYLLGLCDRVAWRLRRDRVRATHLSAYVRYGTFSGEGRDVRVGEATADGLAIFRMAWPLINRLEGVRNLFGADPSARGSRGLSGIRLIGISASGLVPAGGSVSFMPKDQKMERVTQALDRARIKHGEHAWTRGTTMPVRLKERTSGFAYDHEL